jgi:hypothetical protein
MLTTLLFATVVSAQTITFEGDCPGTVDVSVTGMTAGGSVAVLSGAGVGLDAIPGGPCTGTASQLAGLRLVTLTSADGSGNVSVRPTLSGAGCTSPIQVLDVETCALSPVAYPLRSDAEGCDGAVLDQSWRNVDFNDGDGGVEECDIGVAGGEGWYRFAGEGGSRMPVEPQVAYDCGTDAPGWINGTHPAEWGATTTVNVCYHWSGADCNWDNDIRVTNCGQYYAYELAAPPTGCLAYCTTR